VRKFRKATLPSLPFNTARVYSAIFFWKRAMSAFHCTSIALLRANQRHSPHNALLWIDRRLFFPATRWRTGNSARTHSPRPHAFLSRDLGRHVGVLDHLSPSRSANPCRRLLDRAPKTGKLVAFKWARLIRPSASAISLADIGGLDNLLLDLDRSIGATPQSVGDDERRVDHGKREKPFSTGRCRWETLSALVPRR